MSFIIWELIRNRGGTEVVVVEPPPPPATFTTLPTASHLYRSVRRYDAERVMIGAEKDPDEVLDYEIDWTNLLGSDTVLTSQWSLSPDITGAAASNTANTTTIWVSGGTASDNFLAINRVTTADGRVFERTLQIPVRDL